MHTSSQRKKGGRGTEDEEEMRPRGSIDEIGTDAQREDAPSRHGSIDKIGTDAPREDGSDGGSIDTQMQISLEGPKGNHGE